MLKQNNEGIKAITNQCYSPGVERSEGQTQDRRRFAVMTLMLSDLTCAYDQRASEGLGQIE